MAGMAPASSLDPLTCAGCGKPKFYSGRSFYEWFVQTPRAGVPFVTLREFLAPYCQGHSPLETED